MMHPLFALVSPEMISVVIIGVVVGFIVLGFIPYWMILRKAGFSGWWSLLLLVPIVNIIAPWVFALSEWPALRRANDFRA